MFSRKVLVAVFLMLGMSMQAQQFLSTSGKEIVNENQEPVLLRGMGLGGWMVQEGYMLQTAGFANPQHEIRATVQDLIGEEDTDLFYEAWLNNHVQKEDIDALKSWGFNSVRLPMHYNLFTLPIEDEPIAGENTWLTKGFELTDNLISWCAENEMYVILDLHAAPGGQGRDAAISDYDPSKPSLWESQANRDKTVALWRRIAERYADEKWVAGYDLLNEVNWDLPGGIALKNLYQEITTNIREVDSRHIIFIEGNWFANDFTGLTPPWDDNLVYSPHKYWSTNDEKTMQWVIDLRNNFNVPLYLGESGENSNVWFTDAIRLLEDLNIGWAWWPMKKVESISGPLSIEKSPAYQSLLDYWSGNGARPSAEFGKTTLMDLAEGLKFENCRFQPDVIDAMFRQVNSDETIPFIETRNIPGIIYATDYDLGQNGSAYYDVDVANYQVSTGEFTTWNTGWAYRNDGVDIEACQDVVNSNGYNVGWLDNDEWMQYDVNVTKDALYEIHVRIASGGSGGRLHFAAGDADITTTSFAPPTGGWQNWQTIVIEDVFLSTEDKKLKFFVDQAGFNLNSFEFIESDVAASSISTEFVAAVTIDEYSIQMNSNKFLQNPSNASLADFKIFADGISIPITSVEVDQSNPRILNFSVDFILNSLHEIEISYSGSDVTADDGTTLNTFTLEEVRNTLPFVHQIPGRIQAEAFTFESGTELEQSTDVGGGLNLAFLDPGDYIDYEVNVQEAGTYNINFRTAAQFGTGGLEVQLIDADGNVQLISNPTFSSTGDWQNWRSTSVDASLPEGRFTMRIEITQSPFNLNWIEFGSPTASETVLADSFLEVNAFPNPVNNVLKLKADFEENQNAEVEISNLNGVKFYQNSFDSTRQINETISTIDLPSGFYLLIIRLSDGSQFSKKIIRM